MKVRRHSTLSRRPTTANDVSLGRKSDGSEQLLSRLELSCNQLQQQLSAMQRTVSALQAEVDHLGAKIELMAWHPTGSVIEE
jgi:peptidoglycan hydrolase CwlO-like protein